MEIRSKFITADQAIRKISKEFGANPTYVWDVAEEEFIIIKGCESIIDQEHIDNLKKIVKQGLV